MAYICKLYPRGVPSVLVSRFFKASTVAGFGRHRLLGLRAASLRASACHAR